MENMVGSPCPLPFLTATPVPSFHENGVACFHPLPPFLIHEFRGSPMFGATTNALPCWASGLSWGMEFHHPSLCPLSPPLSPGSRQKAHTMLMDTCSTTCQSSHGYYCLTECRRNTTQEGIQTTALPCHHVITYTHNANYRATTRDSRVCVG